MPKWRLVRILVACGVVVTVGVLALRLRACESDGLVVGDRVVSSESCRPTEITDVPVVVALLLAAALLWPDLAEVGFAGISVKRRDRDGARRRTIGISRASAAAGTATAASPNDKVALARYLAAERWLHSIRHPAVGPLAGCRLRLYLFDADEGLLAPAFEEPATTVETFRPGNGAAGYAWETGEYVVASGPDASNDVYGLTPEQQLRYESLAGAAAMPVLDGDGDLIGVLTATTRRVDIDLEAPEVRDEMLSLAAMIGRILVDLLGWFDEDARRNGP